MLQGEHSTILLNFIKLPSVRQTDKTNTLSLRSLFCLFLSGHLRQVLLYQNTKDVFPFIAYGVTEFKNVFCDLIFWQFLFIPPIAPNKNTRHL